MGNWGYDVARMFRAKHRDWQGHRLNENDPSVSIYRISRQHDHEFKKHSQQFMAQQ